MLMMFRVEAMATVVGAVVLAMKIAVMTAGGDLDCQ